MENILEKMVKDRKSEELAKLNAVNIIGSLFNDLMDREKDILVRRFGLKGGKGETLEKIGQAHKLTRERVRQIEAASIKKIKKLDNLEASLSVLRDTVSELIKEHGGFIRRDYLLDILTVYSLELGEGNQDEDRRSIFRNNFDFLLNKILGDDLESVSGENLNDSYTLKGSEMEHLKELADDLLGTIEAAGKTWDTEEIINIMKKLESYQKYQEKLISGNIDISGVFKSQVFPDKAEVIDGNKPLYSLIQSVKNIEQNKYGRWGKADWQEVNPKTINDKIFLVLQHEGKPMHFTEIAEKINEVKFDHKKANPATVHNELILDNRYILTGRGVYGLKQWEK
jgi:hypothetical protein